MKRFKNIYIITFFLLILLFATKTNTQSIDKLAVEQVSIPTVTITDEKLIEFFLEEFMIIEDSVVQMQVIDATGNGFGEDDLIKLYPSNQIYFPVPSDTAQKIMNSWEFRANFRIDTENKPPEVYEELQTNKAPNAIFASLLRGLAYNYKDWPMKIKFERDSSGVTFEMWGYDESKIQFTPPPPPLPDSIVTFDLVHVLRSDTLFVADTTYFDFMYVFKTVSDTVFIKEP